MFLDDVVRLAAFMELNRNDNIIPRGINDDEWLKWRQVIDKIIDEKSEIVRREVSEYAQSMGIDLKEWPLK